MGEQLANYGNDDEIVPIIKKDISALMLIFHIFLDRCYLS